MNIDKMQKHLPQSVFETINKCNKEQLAKWAIDCKKEIEKEGTETHRGFLLSVELMYINHKLS